MVGDRKANKKPSFKNQPHSPIYPKSLERLSMTDESGFPVNAEETPMLRSTHNSDVKLEPNIGASAPQTKPRA